jgi:hypothetical protein
VEVSHGIAANNGEVQKFSKNRGKSEYFIRQKCDMKQVPHGGSANITHINCPGIDPKTLYREAGY